MITIIAATNRPNSSTFKLAKYYQKQLKERGAEADILSFTDLPDCIIATDLYGKRSEEFKPIQELVTKTDKFIFIIPEYNGSFPGVLKVFIDACDRPQSFYNKKAGLVGIAAGKYGNIRGIEHFTGICNYLHLHIHPLRIHITDINNEINEDGNLFKTDTVNFTNEQIDKLVEY